MNKKQTFEGMLRIPLHENVLSNGTRSFILQCYVGIVELPLPVFVYIAVSFGKPNEIFER